MSVKRRVRLTPAIENCRATSIEWSGPKLGAITASEMALYCFSCGREHSFRVSEVRRVREVTSR